MNGLAVMRAGTGTPIRVRIDGASANWFSTTSTAGICASPDVESRIVQQLAGTVNIATGILPVIAGTMTS